jgi:hypothetical protein
VKYADIPIIYTSNPMGGKGPNPARHSGFSAGPSGFGGVPDHRQGKSPPASPLEKINQSGMMMVVPNKAGLLVEELKDKRSKHYG